MPPWACSDIIAITAGIATNPHASAGIMFNIYLRIVQDNVHAVKIQNTKPEYLHGNVRAEAVRVTPHGQAFLSGGDSLLVLAWLLPPIRKAWPCGITITVLAQTFL